ncbi:hypothetical protein JAAARDRAFT_530376 [Jaapia argillacea MUCL 33604]|uniref:Heme peroxidase n=1 Tax=Jaapia argillacea MUCL 33604 TaxID=933084 RepID=A0A067P9N0_9AGAM|nr:hypothetical protein JAAARDRAFT_530376 [Jaapia argillacea MUCL 33604]
MYAIYCGDNRKNLIWCWKFPFSKLGNGKEIDDRERIVFKAFKYMSTLPRGSTSKSKFSKIAIELLHKPHPAQPQLLGNVTGPHSQRQPFARSVNASHPAQALPDVGDVFDSLLRSQNREVHPNGISGLTVAFATIISLTLFRTSPSDADYNETAPRFDLSPLYGSSHDEESLVRNKDGRGMLSPDCFYEDRTLFLPPAVSALLVLWNRNHNFIARRLFLTKTNSPYIDPSTLPLNADGSLESSLASQDDEIFKQARIINCAIFRNAVIEDFLKGLSGLANVGNSADIFEGATTGSGSTQRYWSSVEFSLLYHWFALASQEDADWTERTMETFFGGRSPGEITPFEFTEAVKNYHLESDLDRRRRVFGGLRRGDDGSFSDNDIAMILQGATTSTAGKPGAQGIPACMRVVEIMVMKQARQWNVCSLNDFRKHLGLKPFTKFEEWNSSPEIVAQARRLYKDVANLELYPGLYAEDSMGGSGLSLGYTMTYGLLVDIVTLVRSEQGDPGFTDDHLTDWGYKERSLKPANDGTFGSVLPRVLRLNLPRNYPYDNTYTLLPFSSPLSAKKLLGVDPAGLYTFEKPQNTKVIETKDAISHVFNDPKRFPTTYGPKLKQMTRGYGFLLGFDNETLHDVDQLMILHALIPNRTELVNHAELFATIAEGFIVEAVTKSRESTRSIDVIKEVINPTCARWVCETMLGIRRGGKRKDEAAVFQMLEDLYTFLFHMHESEDGWLVRQKALEAAKTLMERIEHKVNHIWDHSEEGIPGLLSRVYEELLHGGSETKPLKSSKFLRRLAMASRSLQRELGEFDDIRQREEFKDVSGPKLQLLKKMDTQDPWLKYQRGKDAQEEFKSLRLASNVLGLCVLSSVSMARVCTHAVDFYLEPARLVEKTEIIKLSKEDNPAADAKIMGYIREAQRLGQPPGLFRVAAEDCTVRQGKGFPDVAVEKGDLVYADFSKAHRNASNFPNPAEVNCERKTGSVQGLGLHKCPAITFVEATIPQVFKAIFRLENIRLEGRRPVGSATLGTQRLSADSSGKTTRTPRTLYIKYDGEYKQRSPWAVPKKLADKSEQSKTNLKRIDRAIKIILALYIMLYLLALLARSLPSLGLPAIHLPSLPRLPSLSRKPKAPTGPLDCINPIVLEAYHVDEILLGADNKPIPIKRPYRLIKPNRFTVLDVDKRDMQMELLVDSVTRGNTSDFVLDKSVDCGQDYWSCPGKGLSGGIVVVASGKHTFEIRWVGKEYKEGTTEPDWGGERSRRFFWQREECSGSSG